MLDPVARSVDQDYSTSIDLGHCCSFHQTGFLLERVETTAHLVLKVRIIGVTIPGTAPFESTCLADLTYRQPYVSV